MGVKTGIACVATVAALALTQVGCQQLQADIPVLDNVETLIVNDLKAGDSLPQIETDVAQLLAGQPGVDVVEVVNAALTLLVDAGVLPSFLVSTAKNMVAAEQAKLQARAH